MDQDALHAQRVGDPAGMLAARPAEAGERIAGHVMAAGDRDFADGGGHIVDRDVQESLGDLLEALRAAKRVGDLLQPRPRCFGIERLVAVRPENGREILGADPAQEEIAVGHRQRPAGAVAGRAWPRASRFRSDAEAHAVEAADRTAARGNGMDLHHRRADPHAGDKVLVAQLIAAGIMRHVGRRAAHVEADQAITPVRRAGRDHADHAARRAGQDRILAAEGVAPRSVRHSTA